MDYVPICRRHTRPNRRIIMEPLCKIILDSGIFPEIKYNDPGGYYVLAESENLQAKFYENIVEIGAVAKKSLSLEKILKSKQLSNLETKDRKLISIIDQNYSYRINPLIAFAQPFITSFYLAGGIGLSAVFLALMFEGNPKEWFLYGAAGGACLGFLIGLFMPKAMYEEYAKPEYWRKKDARKALEFLEKIEK